MVEQVQVIYDDDASRGWLESSTQGVEQADLGDAAAVVKCSFSRGEQPLQLRAACDRIEVSAWTNYKIVYSTSTRVADAVCINDVAGQHSAFVHRQSRASGVKREVQVIEDAATNSVLLLFEGGFPRGGEPCADVRAPWETLLQREQIPVNGHVIFVIPARGPRRLHPKASASTLQRVTALPEIFESIAKFLPPPALLRANHTCRAWRTHRLLFGASLPWLDSFGREGDPKERHEVQRQEGVEDPELCWLTCCLPQGEQQQGGEEGGEGGGERLVAVAAMFKVELKDQGWGNLKGHVILRAPGVEAHDKVKLVVARAEHHPKKVRVWASLPPASPQQAAAAAAAAAAREREEREAEAEGAAATWDVGHPGRLAPAVDAHHAERTPHLQRAFAVHYIVGGGGGHQLFLKAQVACLVRVQVVKGPG